MTIRRQFRQLKRSLKAHITANYAGLFPDPAEVRLLEILGGSTLTIGSIKRDGRPLTVILSYGYLLKSEHFKRVATDNKSILYMNDINQIIYVRPNEYERNVVTYFEQEESLKSRGFRLRTIPESWLMTNPLRARNSVRQFIYQ